MVVDGAGHLMGRLASVIAKAILQGNLFIAFASEQVDKFFVMEVKLSLVVKGLDFYSLKSNFCRFKFTNCRNHF